MDELNKDGSNLVSPSHLGEDDERPRITPAPMSPHRLGSSEQEVMGALSAQWSSTLLTKLTKALEPLHTLRAEVDWVPTESLCRFPDEVVVSMLRRRAKASAIGRTPISTIAGAVPASLPKTSSGIFIARKAVINKNAASPPAVARKEAVPSVADRRLLPPQPQPAAVRRQNTVPVSTSASSPASPNNSAPIASRVSSMRKPVGVVTSSPSAGGTSAKVVQPSPTESRPRKVVPVARTTAGSPAASPVASVRSTMRSLIDERKRAIKQPVTTTQISSPISTIPTTSLNNSSPTAKPPTMMAARANSGMNLRGPLQRAPQKAPPGGKPGDARAQQQQHVDPNSEASTLVQPFVLEDYGAATVDSAEGLDNSVASITNSEPRHRAHSSALVAGVPRRAPSNSWDIQQRLTEMENMQQTNSVAMRVHNDANGEAFVRIASATSEHSFVEGAGGAALPASQLRAQKLKEALAAKKEARRKASEAGEAPSPHTHPVAEGADLATMDDDDFYNSVSSLSTAEKRRLVEAATPRTRKRIITLKSRK